VAAGGEVNLSVLSNDADPDGDPLTVARLALGGTKGSATIGAGGVIRYRAVAGADKASPGGPGTDSFGYVVADGHGGEATARVTITIPGTPGKPDQDPLESKLTKGIVYLMMEAKGHTLPVCTGWAIRPDLIVTTATALAVLQEYQGEGAALSVGYGGADPRFVEVEDLSLHPLYDKGASGSPLSRAHNVGLVTLKAALPATFAVARSATLPKPLKGMKVAVLTYRLTVEPHLQPLNVLDPPLPVAVQGTVRGMEVAAGSTHDLPLLLLDANVPDGAQGAPVLNEQGLVIGVLAGLSGKRYVVLCDQLEPLLPKDTP
jgi:hypothetical protein